MICGGIFAEAYSECGSLWECEAKLAGYIFVSVYHRGHDAHALCKVDTGQPHMGAVDIELCRVLCNRGREDKLSSAGSWSDKWSKIRVLPIHF